MASRWAAAGNGAELAVYPGGVHGLNALPTALARRANARLTEFIDRHADA
jgi:acetyl esterase/lipase